MDWDIFEFVNENLKQDWFPSIEGRGRNGFFGELKSKT